jgi:thioredoxin reductase
MDTDFDALFVRGAAAGLSAALVIGRARMRTLVVDAGEPSNGTALAIGGGGLAATVLHRTLVAGQAR